MQSDNHPGGTKSALNSVMPAHAGLDRRQRRRWRNALDGKNLPGFRLHGEKQARPRQLPIDKDGASATDTLLAANVCTGKAELQPQRVYEGLARLDVNFGDSPVYQKSHDFFSHGTTCLESANRSDRASSTSAK